MVDDVLKALTGWEPLSEYMSRTNQIVLRCVNEEGVVAFLDKEPWIAHLEATEIDGKTYIKTP